MVGEDRRWRYEGWRMNHPSMEWIRKTENFIDRDFALSRGTDVRCPCSMCRVCRYQDKITLSGHLYKYGYMPNYEVWVYHDEEFPRENVFEAHNNDDVEYDRMEEMLQDLREDPDFVFPPHSKELPPYVKKFFDLLKAVEELLHEHTKVSILAFVTRLMDIKSKFMFSNNCYNELLILISEVFPPNHKMPKDVYQCRKLLSGLGMDYQKIDVCPDNCMLFWKDHQNDKKCQCGKSRYVEVKNDDGEMVTSTIAQKQLRYMPLAPRLKRLFLSRNTARHMRWHKEHEREDTHVMTHPSDSDAWMALGDFDPEFASEARNIRIGLVTDGFTPFNQMRHHILVGLYLLFHTTFHLICA